MMTDETDRCSLNISKSVIYVKESNIPNDIKIKMQSDFQHKLELSYQIC